MSYDFYTNQQNIVANCDIDQTIKIDYSNYFTPNTQYILDIGCRDGKFIKRYSNKYTVYGIDIGDNGLKSNKNVW